MTTLFSWASSADSFNGTTVGTAPTAETAGSYGERLKFAAATTAQNVRQNHTATTAYSCRFIYQLASFASSSHTIQAGYSTGTVQQWKVDLSPTGMLRIRDAANTQVAQGTVNLSAATEYDIKIIRSGSTLTVKAYLASNNTLADSITGTVGTADIVTSLFGNNAALTGTLGAMTYDEIVINNDSTEIAPPVSSVPLSATAVVSPTSLAPPGTITLTITPSGGTGSYTFAVTNWGDGTTSASQSSNVFTKTLATGAAAGAKTITWTVTG